MNTEYELCFDWVEINKGPGTATLQTAQPGEEFYFSGTNIGDTTGYFNGHLTLVEKQHLFGINWVLWFKYQDYPVYVIKITYDSYARSGIAGLWKRRLSPSATAEERAENADASSIMALPVSVMWTMVVILGVLFWLGLEYGFWAEEKSGWAALIALLGGGAGFTAVEIAIGAIYKYDRDKYWKALDVIRALDLRR